MSGIRRTDLARPAEAASPHARMRTAARQLEGVFLGQLIQSMRASAEAGTASGPSPGERMFTELFDERMAQEAALRSRNGIGEAIYRQMARRLPPETPVSADPEIR